MSLYDATRIFPVEEYPFLPGPRYGGIGGGGIQHTEERVAEPIKHRSVADHHPRATARSLVEKLLRNALRDSLGKYFHTLSGVAKVTDLREPTRQEMDQVRAPLVQEPHLRDAFYRIATLRGALLWLDPLDERDGILKREQHGSTYPGVTHSGTPLPTNFRPVGLR